MNLTGDRVELVFDGTDLLKQGRRIIVVFHRHTREHLAQLDTRDPIVDHELLAVWFL